MKICVLAHDLSGGGALTALGMADALARTHEVVIVGPQFGPGLWPALRETKHRVLAIDSSRDYRFFLQIVRFVRPLHVDALVCCKPRFPSLFPALIAKWLWRVPVLLVVDDDELAMTAPGRAQRLHRRLIDPAGYFYTRVAHRVRGRVDATVCVSHFLTKQYGGEVLPLPRDLSAYDPARHDGGALREQLGLAASDFVVGFIGIPRAHKGMDVLLAAMDRIPDHSLRLLVVPPAGYRELGDLRERAVRSAGRILLVEDRPNSEVPTFLAACDAVAIPQRRTPEANAQMPAKLIEAMAMGKAIIATAVSDIPLHLEDRGIVIEPDRVDELAQALDQLMKTPSLRARLGSAARAYYLEHLSVDVLGPRLLELVERTARRAER